MEIDQERLKITENDIPSLDHLAVCHFDLSIISGTLPPFARLRNMKLVTCIFVFTITLFLGVISVSLFFQNTGHTPHHDLPRSNLFQPPMAPDGIGIYVFYAGTGQDGSEKGPYLRLIIYNGTDKWLHYSAEYPTQILVDINVNGKELESLATCGADMDVFNIPPRTSSEARVFSNSFSRRPNKGDRIVLAIPLLPAGEIGTRDFSTEPFVLPEEFRKSVESF